MSTRVIVALLVLAVVSLAAARVHARAKTDIATMGNGDRITGEIKELYRGKLTFKTDGMGTIYIEWEELSRLESQYYFEIEDTDGYKYYGTPELTAEDEVRISRLDAVVTLGKLQVVRITPIEKTFWSRIDGSVNFGVSYTKGSQIGRGDFSGNVKYREEKNFIELRVASNATIESQGEAITRSEGSLTYQRLFQRKLYSDVTGSTFRNDELGIALRLTIGAGLGAHLVQTNYHMLESTLGVSVNREWATDPTVPPTDNFEGVLSAGYTVYKYNTPKSDLSSNVTFFPRLPDFDRLRVDIEVSYTQELVSDFTVYVTFYDNFNSQPPTENDAKNDWGFTSGFGYKF